MSTTTSPVTADAPAATATSVAGRPPGAPPRRFGLEPAQRWLAAPAVLWIVVGLVVPLGAVVVFSFWTGSSTGMQPDLTVQNYARILTNATFWSIFRWTLTVLVVVLAAATVIGLPVAYYAARIPRLEWTRTLLVFFMFVPFVVSYVIRVITWIPLFGRQGLLNSLLVGVDVLSAPADVFLYSSPSMITALVFLYVAFFVGPVYFKLRQVDDQLLFAAQNLGASPVRMFLTVELPLIRPGIVTGWLFVSVMVLSDFATERLIGGGLSPMLAGTVWRRAEVLLWPQASSFAVVLVIITLTIVIALFRVARLDDEL